MSGITGSGGASERDAAAIGGTAAPEGASLGAETSHEMARLFGRDSLYVLFWGLQLAFAALITPIATRLLSSSSYGRVMAATAVMQVLVAIGSVSLQSAVQRQYHEPDGERGARRLVTLAILISLGVFALADLSGPAWSSLLRLGPYRGAIQFAVAWATLTAISDAALGWIRSRDQLRVFGAVSLLQSVVAAALSLALVLLVRRTAGEFLLGQLIAQAVAVLLALSVSRPLAIRRRDLAMVRGALRYAGALVPAALAAFGLGTAARLIIQHDLGSTAVARYSIAFNIGAAPLILLGVLDISWMPRMFALSDRLARSALLRRSRDAVYALLVPTVIGLSAGAPIVLAAWAPPSYHPTGLLVVVALLCASALPVAGTIAATRVLLISGRTGPVGSRTVVAAIATVGLTVLLVPRLKIDGAAFATLVGFILQYALLARAAHAVEPMARPSARLAAGCFAAVVVAGVCTQIPTAPGFIAARALLTAACVALFAALLCELVVPGRFAAAARIVRGVRLDVTEDAR